MFWVIVTLFFNIYCSLFHASWCEQKDIGLILMTVATEANDAFLRYANTAHKYHYDLKVLGMGQKWEGGDVLRFPGGGQKILLLREALEPLKEEKNLIIMFTDSYDVVLSEDSKEVVKTFKKFDTKVLFSAEEYCWPDPSVADKYPTVKLNEKRYLNSGGFIGYAPYIYKLLHQGEVAKTDDDQLYYTNIFLNKSLRFDIPMKLDVRSEIFQNLNGALEDVQVKFMGNSSYLYNHRTGNIPMVIHGNGPIKHHFNRLTNYLADQWTPTTGCRACEQNSISLVGVKTEDYPTVFMTLYLNHPTAFAEDFLNNIGNLEYPKDKITLFIHYSDKFHEEDVKNFMDKYGLQYRTVELLNPTHGLDEGQSRNKAIEHCLAKPVNCQYLFSVDGEVQLEDTHTLIDLIQRNRSVVAPLLSRPGRSWSSFWGSLNDDGFYQRSDDYVTILNREQLGLWNVPYVSYAYLIQGHLAPKLENAFINEDMDADMAICKSMRDQGIFMYVDNNKYYGHLVDSDNIETTHLHNDLYQLFDNKYTWEKKYLHHDYQDQVKEETILAQPCTDVFWFPMLSTTFCDHLVEEMENLNQWSGGRHEDNRLAGGYENVPTVDTHTNQIGFEKHWLQIIKDYISPVAAKVYKGYYPDSRAIMNFVVRYKPDEQDRLRPHADSSTFTVNGALNTAHVDYEGGGVRFLRYNCTLVDTKKGWFLMHPGRLTHHHEGLPTVSGTRYIMISFIDP